MQREKFKKITVMAVVMMIVMMMAVGCSEVEDGVSNWKANGGDPSVQSKPTATDDMLVGFGEYPNTVAESTVAGILNTNIRIDDVTGLWTEYDSTSEPDAEGNVAGVHAYYDLQTGYYVYEELVNGATTTSRSYALVNNRFFLVQQLQWIILEEQGDDYLLIAREVVDAGLPYLDNFASSTWNESSLRDWLNGTDEYARGQEKFLTSWNFIDRAFTDQERSQLQAVTIDTPDNTSYNTEGGGSTTDYIYLLSAEEIAQYFGENLSAQSTCTPYAARRGVVAESQSRGTIWWLRSPGLSTQFQAVDRNGDINAGGFASSDTSVGIRPVIKVAKSAVEAIDTTLPTAGPIETPTPRPTVRPTGAAAEVTPAPEEGGEAEGNGETTEG